jgi:hypothetical protein
MSTLHPGIPVIAAPRFHIDGVWPERLSLNSGVAIDDRYIYPRTDWRPPTQSELELITKNNADPTSTIQLFSITDRLRAQWWSLAAESSSEAGLESAAFQKFAKDVLEYLLFKRMPVPSDCDFEVLLTAPGQPSVQLNASGLLAEQTTAVLLGGINLSDEDASMVFLNLRGNLSATTNIDERRSFLLENRDYPLTRVVLRPREGYWLPNGSIIMDRDTRGRTEVDVHLVIKKTASTLCV